RLVRSQSKGLRKGLGIVDGQFVFHVSEIAAPQAFGDPEGLRLRMSAHVEPPKVVEARRMDHHRVLFPVPNGVTQPGGIQIFEVLGKLPPIGEDGSMRTVRRLMEHYDQPSGLDDLRQTSKIEERDADGQAASKWTVLPE